MRQFAIGMVIQAIDRVTGPSRGINASIRKMTEAERELVKASAKNGKPPKVAEDMAKARERWAKAEEERKKRQRAGGLHIGGFFDKIGGALPQIGAVVTGVALLGKGYQVVTKASDEAVEAQLKLQTAMLHVKGTTQKQVDAVADLAGEIQKRRPVDDETLKSGAAQFAMFGMNAKQIHHLLPALSDLLVMNKGVNATTEDGIASAKSLGKAFAGNSGALRKQGIILTAAQEAILKHGTATQKTAVIVRAIESRAGGVADKLAKTPAGIKKMFEQQLNEVEETAGAALKPLREGALNLANKALPYLAKAAEAIPRVLTKGAELVKKGWSFVFGSFSKGFKGTDVGDFIKNLKGWAPTLKGLFGRIVPIVQSVVGFIYKAIGQIAGWMVTYWNKAQPGLHALAQAFVPVIDVLKELWFKVVIPLWDNALAPLLGWLMGSFYPFLVNTLAPAVKFVVTVIAVLIKRQINMFSDLFRWFGKAWQKVSGFFTGLWKKIEPGWNLFKEALTTAWHSLFDDLFAWIEDKWKGFMDMLKGVANYLGFGDDGAATTRPVQGASGAGPKSMIDKSKAAFDQFTSKNPPLMGPMQVNPNDLRAMHGQVIHRFILPDGVKVQTTDPYGLMAHRGLMGGFA